MPETESVESRLTRLEVYYEQVAERLGGIEGELKALYKKTESDKAELKVDIAGLRSELKGDIAGLQVSLVKWMVGLLLGFLTLNTVIMWALLTFAVR